MLVSNRGRRLLPSLVDEIARKSPEQVLYSLPKDNNPAKGFVDVTARCFARAVNRCSRFLENELGRGQGFPTITYMGPQDLLYGILILAAIKTGYKLLLTSPRNTLEAQLYLFEQTECDKFLLPAKFPLPIVKQILDSRPMRVVETPVLQHWLEDGQDEFYPYGKTFEEAQHEPFVVLHTSGSTGLPKPVTQTHATWAPLDAQCDLPTLGHKPVYPATLEGKRLYMTFPLFHCAGVAMLVPAVIYCGYTSVLGPWPPSADVANSVHLHGNVQQTVLVPTVLVDLAKDPQYLENLSRLELITYGGGPLPKAVGSLVTTKTKIQSVLGSTEAGVMPVQEPDRDDWEYMSFSPMLGSKFRHVSGELYEHVIVRDEENLRFQGVFGTFKDIREWPMKDIYSRHPTKENSWLYRGRADDIIVFATGEKINPLTMEDIINNNPAVRAAIVAGVGRFQSSLLIEPTSVPASDTERAHLIDLIWPAIEAANEQSPQHGQIHRNMVIFTTPEKPMLRAGKGTVQRKLTLDLYQTELDGLYLESDESTLVDKYTSEMGDISVEDAVKELLAASTTINLRAADKKANFFELGMDSLQVTTVARRLNKLLRRYDSKHTVQPRSVYANPSIQQLTNHIKLLVDNAVPTTEAGNSTSQMQATYEELRGSLPISARSPQPKPSQEVVLLTGSTGSLGSYTLHALIENASVSTIYCLNRRQSSSIRQAHSHNTKVLSTAFDKVQFLEGDYSAPYFGLPLAAYRALLVEVTQIVHIAWQVDFNLDLQSFAKQLQIVRRLTEFSGNSRFGARFLFVSSIATVANFAQGNKETPDIPEQAFDDWRICQSTGYGQSKLVAERFLDSACQEADIPVTICRVGQIAGPTSKEGAWPAQEWFPSLIASSKHLGKLPSSLGSMETIDWVPVDKAGQIVSDFFLNSTDLSNGISAGDRSKTNVYHLVNPKRTRWADLVPDVKASLESKGHSIELVSLGDWVALLEQSASGFDNVGKNPAAKIVDFYKSLTVESSRPISLETTRSVQASKTLGTLGFVSTAWMKNWLRQLGY